ncbi:MAG: HU family DNA-binding protein [Tannerellaceae bacterium]|nr:HU family DNA-binding protein [Tannerellaceae bacterium]
MNNRLSIPELAGLLAEYTGVEKKKTERFLKELVSVVREAVFEDKIVKIKGIGTFKIIEVQDRESVDVNTGKRILIPGHYKFSFLPDKELKEEVNKPFSFFETVEISDHIDSATFEHPEEEVSADVVPEINAETEVVPDPEPISVEEEPAIVAENESEELQEEEPEEPFVDAEIQIPQEEPVKEEELIEQPGEEDRRPGFFIPKVETREETDEQPVTPKKQKSKTPVWWIAAITVIVLGSGVFFFFNRGVLNAWNRSGGDLAIAADSIADNLINEMFVETDSLQLPIDEENPDADPAVLPDSNTAQEDIQKVSGSPISVNNDDIIATVKMTSGNRLTLIALEHYGDKVFWVYLYEHNKESIKDPNNIPIGTEIKIPNPALYNINANSKSSIEKAALLQSRILSAL